MKMMLMNVGVAKEKDFFFQLKTITYKYETNRSIFHLKIVVLKSLC